MGTTQYRYELRKGTEIAATGHLSLEAPLQVGDEIAIGSGLGRVVAIEATLGNVELRLIIELDTGT